MEEALGETNQTTDTTAASTLADLRASGWRSRSVKEELRANMADALRRGEALFPGIVGYDDTVIPEIVNGVLAGHDLLFLGEKGQAKSKLMRMLTRFLDPAVPYLDIPGCAVHEDPERPITSAGKRLLADTPPERVPIAWWPREQRYAERLAPGTRFADVIGEIDPSRLIAGASLEAEEALSFGLIPRMHRGVFAMNELPDLDDQVQVGLFNILEERDVQIRGVPISFDVDVLIAFSANPSTYNRSGKVIAQLKDRIGTTVRTHYPRERGLGIEIMLAAAGDTADVSEVLVPPFMAEIVEQVSICARQSQYVDHESGVSLRLSQANYRTMVASARQRALRLGERPAVPRISDLAHLAASTAGKLELDLMGAHQMDEARVFEAILAEAIETVFDEYATGHGLDAIADAFRKGVRVEVGDTLPSAAYELALSAVPAVWDKAFEVNASGNAAVRAACAEFVLAGLHAKRMVSRGQRHGRVEYDT